MLFGDSDQIIIDNTFGAEKKKKNESPKFRGKRGGLSANKIAKKSQLQI